MLAVPACCCILQQQEDQDRRVYGLKEERLAVLLVEAAGLDRKRSADARAALKWKQAGVRSAGNFPAVMEQVGGGRQCMAVG